MSAQGAGPGSEVAGRPVRLPAGGRVVVKIGSSSLTRGDGGLDLNRIDQVAALVARLRRHGQDIVLVASGAVAAGLPVLGLQERPSELSLLQATASVGQSRIMGRWEASMSTHGVIAAQVLLTAQDVAVRAHYRTVRSTFNEMLRLGAVPVVNENDAVASSELSLGDNDRLAALVAHLVTADLLVLLTDVDGVWTAPPGTPGARPLRYVAHPDDLAGIDLSGRGSALGTGGMRSKVQAASIACASGTATLVARADDAVDLLGAQSVPPHLGTWLAPTGPHRPSRRLWIAHASHPEGRVLIDAGAAQALTVGKKSLLAPGVTGVEGEFEAGAVIEAVGPEGVVARGISRYTSAEIGEVLAARASGTRAPDRLTPVIHRDDLAELPRTAGH